MAVTGGGRGRACDDSSPGNDFHSAALRSPISGKNEAMKLPIMPPVSPMLAKSVSTIPPDASYEPKWDGFQSICFRDGEDVELGSRNERPLTRYFPELIAAMRTELPERCVIDGEIIIATDHGLDFEALQQRIHPADSRVRMLGQKAPASYVAFDLLALGDDDYTRRPFSERCAALHWRRHWPTPAPQSTSRRRPPISRLHNDGSRSLKEPVSTASSPNL